MRIKILHFSICSLWLLCSVACVSWPQSPEFPEDFREEMRRLVIEISRYGRTGNPRFIVIPQNGQELLTGDGQATGEFVRYYGDAIDGVGREDLFYGYTGDNVRTPSYAEDYMIPYLALAESEGIEVLTIDYCSTAKKMDDSIKRNESLGFISFAADRRALDSIPSYPPRPFNENSGPVTDLSEASNFLYLINPAAFPMRDNYIETLAESSFDVLIIDLFDDEGLILTKEEIDMLKIKPSGASRLVIAYMSIGEAEDYRFYWRDFWNVSPPEWVDKENPHWPGNFKVRYWDPGWKDILYGRKESYLDLILERGFDGVYLDLIDAFEFYESGNY